MLVGRTDERARLDGMLAGARLGTSAVLLVRGEPGIGKTTLLLDAMERATAVGMATLSARGIESEAEVPFSGLLELLGPALGELERIPEPQAAALRGALALGPGVEAGRFLVGAATLSLLAAHAETSPLLVVVDDAHSLDPASAAAVVFAARRLLADRIAVLVAVRAGEAPAVEGAGLPRLDLDGLDGESAAALLAHNAGGSVSSAAGERFHRATRGNPLALLELAREAPRLGPDPIDGPVPIGAVLESAFLRRAGVLSDEARRVLLVAAADGSGELGAVERAAAALGFDVAALEEAERAGFISIDRARVAFRHPLMRSAVYHAAEPAERRVAHRAVADGLREERDADRRAWHLAAAAFGPDESVAGALEVAGRRARAQGAHTAAAAALERAARLSREDEVGARRLIAAADAAWMAGEVERTEALLEEGLGRTSDPRLQAEAEHLRGLAAARSGPVMAGYDILVGAASRIEATDPLRAALMYADATHACLSAGQPKRMVEAGRRASALLPPGAGERESALVALALGTALIYDGQGAEGARLLRGAVSIVDRSTHLEDDPLLLSWVGLGVLFLREAGTGRALLARAIECARAQGALGILPLALFIVARDAATSDRWAIAEAEYDEAIRLARETGQEVQLCWSLAGLACIEARWGRESGWAHAREALEVSERLGLGFTRVWSLGALADLEVAVDRLDEAIARLEERARALEELGIADADLSPAPELVEAYVRTGRAPEAVPVAAAYVSAAEQKGQPWALARAERCRGLLADDASFERHFARAREHHEATTDAFEEARTRLCFGERLRRARRRVDARTELREAFAAFERLGAAPWAERARTELLATGETARRRDASAIDQLTPQELRIALVLAEGRTTREAASMLYVSAKTIEYHLRNVYRKLGIRSRDALAEALQRELDDRAGAPVAG